MGGVALVAGGDPLTALRLGVAMTALQASIGSLNDLVDAPSDAIAKPAKPIPAGLVGRGLAGAVTAAAGITGLVLAAPSGAPALVIAGLTLAIGYGYDLRLKGTAVSWLPFALGIPLLPLFGWVGATGTAPASFAALLPMAALAGAALAIANARADAERDAASGVRSVALALGEPAARRAGAAAWAVALAIAIGWLVVTGAASGPRVVAVGVVAVGSAAVVAGIGLGWRSTPALRELAWEVQAVGAGVAAIGWVGATTV